ncbi:MAG: FAD-dependent oxidoreductase [Acidobacteriota bacterium]|nr:FAD-dependent oxidoreductase [Acidobacteriota bacterium]
MDQPVILAVDDDPQVLRAVARDLRRHYGEDYRIIRAGSGDEALEVLEALAKKEQPLALVLSDQRMPQMDGVSLLGKTRERFPKAKRALLTAYADTEAAIDAINRSQVDYYLLKPWDPPEQRLYPVLDDLLTDWRSGYRPGFGGLRIVGDRWSPESHALRDFLARNQVPYEFLDVEGNTEARELAGGASGNGSEGGPDGAANEGVQPELPVVLLPGGERLERPTPSQLAEHVGLKTEAQRPFYQLAIVGGGPAGLASAVYGASEGLNTVLVEGEAPGGQAGTSSRIENYLGFPAGLSGADLARRAVVQARRFGVELLTPQRVEELRVDGPYKRLVLDSGQEIACHALMLAMGVAWRRLPAEGAEELSGRGIYYGAAMSEAISCQDEVVYIVGAGNSAGQAAMFFAEYATKVVMVVRGDSLAAKMSHYLVERIEASEVIEVRLGTEITACHGGDRLEELTLRQRDSGDTETIPARMLFVFIGAAPHTEWLGDLVARDSRGFVLTGPDLQASHLAGWPLERPPFLLETNVPGVFAAGDVRSGSVKRVASATGEGSVSVHFVHRFLASL